MPVPVSYRGSSYYPVDTGYRTSTDTHDSRASNIFIYVFSAVLAVILLLIFCCACFFSRRRQATATAAAAATTAAARSSTTACDHVELDLKVEDSVSVLVYSCGVCSKGFTEGDKGRVFVAREHRFHAECVEKRFGCHGRCPFCKAAAAADGAELPV